MKIVFLSRLYKPHIGGVERHIEGICKILNPQNEITVITEQHDNSLQLRETIDGVSVIRIPLKKVSESRKKLIIWKWFIENRLLLDSVDIIHCHDVVYWMYLYKLLNPFKKIFATFHGWEGIYPIPIKNKIKRQLDAKITYGNISIGDFISKWYGIKSNFVSYGATNSLGKSLQKTSNSLLFLGRLDHDTGFLNCLEIYKQHKTRLKWDLVIAGDGPLKKYIPKEGKFLGFVSNPENVLSNVKYVYTTGYLGILESLSYAKPVICSYSNPVKKDYLLMHPMSKYFNFSGDLIKKTPKAAVQWADSQTWKKLSNQYISLWEL